MIDLFRYEVSVNELSLVRYSEYVNTFPEDESERENFSKYATRNTLAGVYRIAAHGKTVSTDDTG